MQLLWAALLQCTQPLKIKIKQWLEVDSQHQLFDFSVMRQRMERIP